MRQIILASQSSQRKNILATLGVPFKVVPANIDEQAVTASTQEERARLVARAKAEKVQQQYPEAIIIAGDTYVIAGEQVLEKPRSVAEAGQMLSLLSDSRAQALTGVCYLDPERSIALNQTVVTDFVFRRLSTPEITHYVQHNPVLTWSAGFSPAYEAGMALIASTSGSFTSFTHGLPIELVADCLTQSGISV